MKFYTLSPECVPENQVLFPTMRPYFISQGHSFVERIEDCDIVLFDLHSRISSYNIGDIHYLLSHEIPTATFDEYDRGNMSSDQWPTPLTKQQWAIFESINYSGSKSVHFCRLLDKTKTNYPKNLYPYEKPIIYEELPLNPDELFNREYDLFWYANSSPTRIAIAKAFQEDGRFKCNFKIGEPKIPFENWLAECKKSKLFIKASAGGYSDERLQALFSLSAMALERNDQLLASPFTHLQNCINFDSPPTKKDLDTIYELLNDKHKLLSIYANCYSFVKKNYSAEAFGKYYLEKITKHLL